MALQTPMCQWQCIILALLWSWNLPKHALSLFNKNFKGYCTREFLHGLFLMRPKKYNFSDRSQLLNKVQWDFIIIPRIDGTPVDCAQDLLLRRGPLATTSSQSFVETLKLKKEKFSSHRKYNLLWLCNTDYFKLSKSLVFLNKSSSIYKLRSSSKFLLKKFGKTKSV